MEYVPLMLYFVVPISAAVFIASLYVRAPPGHAANDEDGMKNHIEL